MSLMKSFTKLGLGIALLFLVGYLALPQYRPLIVQVAPFLLLLLVCPLAMYFMKGSMNRSNRSGRETHKQPEQGDA